MHHRLAVSVNILFSAFFTNPTDFSHRDLELNQMDAMLTFQPTK